MAIIVKALTGHFFEGGIPLWVSNLVLNIPVFVLAYLLLGRKFVGRTLFGALMLSVWLAVLPAPFIQPTDLLLTAVFGGIIIGAGVGLVFLGSATTGGTDLVAALIHKGMRHYSLATILMVLDGAVVLAGLTVFGLRPALYAIITIYTATKVTDAMLEGLKISKAAFIISAKANEIAEEIMEKLDRGATGIPAVGMYTGGEKLIVYCVVSRKEIVQVKDIAEKHDPAAFVIVSDAREVLGEGFQERGGILN